MSNTPERDWILTDYQNSETKTLLDGIEWQSNLILELQGQIEKANHWKLKYQQEIDRRALEAYWREHPELIRFEVGDKLLVTKDSLEYIKHKQGYKIGDVVTVEDVDPYNDVCVVSWPDNDMAVPSIETSSHMRRAYLRQESQNATHST